MTFNPDIHHRRSIRLREYDYSSVGAYFVTVCANGRECLFGDCAEGDMRVNNVGRMVAEWWLKLPERFLPVSLDEFVIMPNHFHGIIVLYDFGLWGIKGFRYISSTPLYTHLPLMYNQPRETHFIPLHNS